MMVGYAGPVLSYASALNPGVEIGPDGNFMSNVSYSGYLKNVGFLGSVYADDTYGQFPGADTKFLGLKFKSNDSVHFGWIRLYMEVRPVYFTIVDYAYEDEADTPISTGQMVSSVNDIASFNAFAYTFGNTVYVQIHESLSQAAKVKLFDMSGKCVFSGITDTNEFDFPILNASDGIYMLTVEANNSTFTKELLIAL